MNNRQGRGTEGDHDARGQERRRGGREARAGARRGRRAARERGCEALERARAADAEAQAARAQLAELAGLHEQMRLVFDAAAARRAPERIRV